MYNVHLTHSLLCFEFVELTLFYNKVFFFWGLLGYGRAGYNINKNYPVLFGCLKQ